MQFHWKKTKQEDNFRKLEKILLSRRFKMTIVVHYGLVESSLVPSLGI